MKSIGEFDRTTEMSTGGVTGSARVKGHDGSFYQLKPSILDNPSYLRRLKAWDNDRENFGEVIASHVGRSLLGEHSAPEVSLVYDARNKKVSIASKYFESDDGSDVSTLNDYAITHGVAIPKGRKFVVCAPGELDRVADGVMALDGPLMVGMKESLADALALSAIVGDHDVNPGNLVVMSNQGSSTIARIDLGHAFNDLLNTSTVHGGQLRDRHNPVVDFFNRLEVAGILGDPSKLHLFYPGIAPSEVIIDALKKFGGEDTPAKVAEGIQSAKEEFVELLEAMERNGDQKGIKHVSQSLAAIYENITGEELNSKLDLVRDSKVILRDTFAAFETFVNINCTNAQRVANVMELQVEIDRSLKTGSAIPAKYYDALRQQQFPMEHGKIQWVKQGEPPAFIGSFEEYVAQRAHELSKSSDHKADVLRNYKALREKSLEEMYLSTQSLKRNTVPSHVTTDLRDKVQVLKKAEYLSKLDTPSLVAKLQEFIDKRMSSGEKKSFFRSDTKQAEVNAANALIRGLHGDLDSNFYSRYDSIIKEGELGQIIKDFMRTVPELKINSNPAALDCLIEALEFNQMPLIQPPDQRLDLGSS